MAKVAATTRIPLAADETITGPEEGRRARAAGQCALAALKLSKVGGPGAALEIAAAIPSYMSSALDGPVGIAAAAYTVQAMRDLGHDSTGLAHGLATQRLFAATIASTAPRLEGDMLHLPEGPGLGVEIDEKALAAHRL
jgi:muconate cycloisomerase